ncbi:MAG TPA: copper-binding protein [Thermoanaerobaculia bacterium]|nr:copper-binding protein [Thermoanaerobaculia bacterium]
MRKELKPNLAQACAVALMVFLIGTAAGGCGPKQAEPEGRDYTLRAQVVKPPDAGGLYIYHEAIDDWVGRDGKVSGMDTMAMPFPVAQGVPLDGIQANDKVEVKLHVDWSSDRPAEITAIRELPPETQLVFRAAKPPKNP